MNNLTTPTRAVRVHAFASHNCSILLGLLACILSSAVFAGGPAFPRLGGIQIGNPFDYDDPTYEGQMARQNVVLLGDWPGFTTSTNPSHTSGGASMQSVVQGLKALNPNLQVFAYVVESEIAPEGSQPDGWTPVRNKLDAMHWWLYPSGTTGSPVPAAFQPNIEINNTIYTAADPSGLNSVQWLTQFLVTQLYSGSSGAPALDGLYMDLFSAAPHVNGDWNLDGTTDNCMDSDAAGFVESGYTQYVGLVRSSMPGKLQIGNVGDWTMRPGDPNNCNENQGFAIPTSYQYLIDGGVLEAMIGKPSSLET